jgi:hypothetical protein
MVTAACLRCAEHQRSRFPSSVEQRTPIRTGTTKETLRHTATAIESPPHRMSTSNEWIVAGRGSVTGDPCLIRSCGWSSRRRRANPKYDWSWDWSRLAISVQPRTLGFQFSDPAFQRVNVLVEVEYREHRYAYVPAVPLELEPTNKLFLSLSLATLPNTRNVHPLMIAETDLDAARLKARLVAKPRRRQPADSCCGSRMRTPGRRRGPT